MVSLAHASLPLDQVVWFLHVHRTSRFSNVRIPYVVEAKLVEVIYKTESTHRIARPTDEDITTATENLVKFCCVVSEICSPTYTQTYITDQQTYHNTPRKRGE